MLYEWLNKYVLSLVLKMSVFSAVCIATGRIFHNLRPTKLKDPLCTSAILDLVMGRSSFVEDLRPVWPCSVVMSSCRYEGAIPLRHLNTKTATLIQFFQQLSASGELIGEVLCDHVSVAWIWPFLPYFRPFVTCSNYTVCIQWMYNCNNQA